MSVYPDKAAFQTHLETLGVDQETLLMDVEPTISLGRHGELEEANRARDARALHTLPELAVDEDLEVGASGDLTILETLGEGGMGVVRLARQVALDREVAVKTTRADVGEAAARSLLQEAYVTGYLEHPNIIPIYMVGRTPKGAPLIVMKRVEGRSWLEMLEASADDGPPEDLTRHVEILMQVASATWFANSRGVIHRDIKPDNVMLGDYGEVYLLDWGIAATSRDDRPLLPRLEETRQLRGTPGYMAPEMAEQELELIDERTDVYLLGATLHHILTGRPRHKPGTLLQMLFAAHRSEPYEYGQGVPDELGAIANRACHRDRDQRFATAREFRDALENFLEHRQSVALSDAACDKLEVLQGLLGADETAPRAIHDTYGECRFGFYEALRTWPENEGARQGLQRCLEAMIAYHLAQENLEAAKACLEELPESREGLSEQIQELEERLKKRQHDLKRLERLERALDLSTARGSRSLLMIALGIIWTATSFYAAVRVEQGWVTAAEDLRHHMTSGLRNLAVGGGLILLFRKRFFANRANVRLVYLFWTMLAVVAFFRWTTWYLEADLFLARIGDMVIYVLALVAVGLMSDLRICLIASAFGAGAVASVIWPEWILYFNSVATALTFAGFAWIWRPQRTATEETAGQ